MQPEAWADYVSCGCWPSQAEHRDGEMEGEEEDEEEPPTEYDEDGVLTTSLHSFSDLRIIKAMAPDPSAPGQCCHACGDSDQLAPKLPMTDAACLLCVSCKQAR